MDKRLSYFPLVVYLLFLYANDIFIYLYTFCQEISYIGTIVKLKKVLKCIHEVHVC